MHVAGQPAASCLYPSRTAMKGASAKLVPKQRSVATPTALASFWEQDRGS